MSNSFVSNLDTVPSNGLTDEALSVDNTAGGVQLAASGWTALNTQYVTFQVQDDQIRATFDGSSPTSSNGFLLNVGDSGRWPYAKARVAKFIRVTTNAVLFAQPERT